MFRDGTEANTHKDIATLWVSLPKSRCSKNYEMGLLQKIKLLLSAVAVSNFFYLTRAPIMVCCREATFPYLTVDTFGCSSGSLYFIKYCWQIKFLKLKNTMIMLVHLVYELFAPNMFGRMMKYALRCSKCHQYCKAPTFKPKSHIYLWQSISALWKYQTKCNISE